MKLTLHSVSNFADGVLAMATVEGMDASEKHWIVFATQGKYVIRLQSDSAPITDKDQQFDSPELALAELERSSSR
jgi:hypothetical protein